jgi:hypothetical protein
VWLGATLVPGHPEGEPFTDPQHPLEVSNGRSPAFRAWKFPRAISSSAAFSNDRVSGETSPRRHPLTAYSRDVLAFGQQPIGRHQLAHNPLRSPLHSGTLHTLVNALDVSRV